jgi:hypothetical protein
MNTVDMVGPAAAKAKADNTPCLHFATEVK